MKTINWVLVFLLFLFSVSCIFAQQPTKEYIFTVRGRVVDRDKEPYHDVSLEFFKDGTRLSSVRSDENGSFLISLPAGKYWIGTTEKFSKDFLTFIEITENGLNPTNFDLVVELNKDWCVNCPPGKSPEVVKYIAPPYPPAALAMAAMGEVVINIRIDGDGKAVYAKAISGHPLMRKVSETAAQQWIFTADKTNPEREGKLVFFFDMVNTEKPMIRLKRPNRLEIFYPEKQILNITNK